MSGSDHPSGREPRSISRRGFLSLLGLGGAAGMFWLLVQEAGRRANADRLAALAADAQRVAALRPAIISRADWGALLPNLNAPNENGLYSLDNPEGYRVYEGDLRDVYRTVVIHHSATYGRDDLHTLLYIQNLHRHDRGWADIAYHFLIGKAGVIYAGRPLNVRGTHVAGYNTGSVGVCLLGNLRLEAPTASQILATLQLVRWLAVELQLTHLAGHYEFNADTDCPGANLIPYLDVFARAAGLTRGTGGYVPSPEQIIQTATAAPPNGGK